MQNQNVFLIITFDQLSFYFKLYYEPCEVLSFIDNMQILVLQWKLGFIKLYPKAVHS